LREAGPFVDNEEYKLLIEKFSKIYHKYKLITISGSIPQNMNKNVYYDLVSIANKSKIKALVDAKGEVLEKVLEAKPFMIKINQSELSELVGKDISNEKDLIAVLDDLIAKGIQVAIVSIGEKGLLANWQGVLYKVNVPQVKVVSTVGSGDAVLAGLSYGITNNLDIENTLKLGASMGTAAAMSAATGQYNKSDLEWVRKNVEVNILRQDYNSNDS
jgi:tagatose 6-phosphate kinase